MGYTYKNHILTILVCFLSYLSGAQDIHLSNIHASPTLVNPSMVGIFEGKLRFTANMRSQWNSVTNGYKTMMASSDFKLNSFSRTDIFSGGIQVTSDRAGDLDFNNTSAGLTLAYLKGFDNQGNNFVSFGTQLKYVNMSLDFSKINSRNNITALNYDYQSALSYLDFSAGLSTFIRPNGENTYYAGVAVHHLNSPEVSFLSIDDNDPDILHQRFNVHGGASIKVTEKFTVKPSILFMKQGPNSEMTVGSFFQFKPFIKGKHRSALHALYLGGWLRTNILSDNNTYDAFVVSGRMDYKSMQINLSYDINISSYSRASNGLGGMELSFVQLFHWKGGGGHFNVECPEF